LKKFYYLSSCSTCKRIMDELSLPGDVVLQDIKTEPISEKELKELYQLAGSYEVLFSERAQLYKERDLKSKNLSETDYKNLILEHYTFLKRPVLVLGNQIFIGNSTKTVLEAQKALHG